MAMRNEAFLNLNLNNTVVNMKMDNSKFDKDGKFKQGVHQEYFKNGSLSCEGIFKDGEKNGQWKYFLANGQLKAVGKYIKGKMTGEWKWYRENGKLLQIGSLDNDMKTGVWTRYGVTVPQWMKQYLLTARKVKSKSIR